MTFKKNLNFDFISRTNCISAVSQGRKQNFILFRLIARFFLPSALLLVFLSGCGGGEDDTVVVVETGEEVVLEGTLQSLGSSITNSDATHLLRLEDGTIVYAYSKIYDLDDGAYLNQDVEAEGWLVPSDDEGGKDLLRIDVLSLVEEEGEDDEEITMVPYVNQALGFALLYQNDWTVEEAMSYVAFSEPVSEDLAASDAMTEEAVLSESSLDLFTVANEFNAQGLSVEDWYLAYADRSSTDIYALNAIGPDLFPAVKVEAEYISTYYIEGGDEIFVITAQFSDSEREAEHRRLFAEMLYSFDLLSDGLREDLVAQEEDDGTTEEDTFDAPNEDDAGDSDSTAETDDANVLTETQEAVMEEAVTREESGWRVTHYSFVDPSYVYVEFAEIEGAGSLRVLYGYAQEGSDFTFEELARFEPGDSTDWELVSGENVAKGQPSIEVDASSGRPVFLPEGYSLVQSAILHFQMAYPSSWYYVRSGDFYYFSDEPAEASNALVTLEWVSTPVESFETTADETTRISVPFDESGSFMLSGLSEYADIMTVMGQSLVLF
jgi:hypothetical protein